MAAVWISCSLGNQELRLCPRQAEEWFGPFQSCFLNALCKCVYMTPDPLQSSCCQNNALSSP